MRDKAINRRQLILEGNLWKAIFILAIPAGLNRLIQSMYNLIDTYFVTSIGRTEVAAITFVGPISNLIQMLSLGLAIAGTTLIAREIGRENYERARNAAMQLLNISIIIGIVIAIGSYIYSAEILLQAAATEGIIDTANLYFRLIVFSTPFFFINSIYLAIKNAEGDTMTAMVINMIAMSVKIILSYFFVMHLKIGIAGLAYSTVIGNMLVSIYGLYDLFFKPSIIKLGLKDFGFNKSFVWGLILIASPVMIEKASIQFSFIVLNKYVIDYGEAVLAGYGITNRFNSLFFGIITGFASGLSPIISQNLGAGNGERAKKAVNKAFIMAVTIATVIIALILPFRREIAGIFIEDDPVVLYHTVNAMSVYSITVIPWAIFQVANGAFQGTGHTKYNMIISMVRIYAFRLPTVIFLTKFSDLGEYSIWYSMLISNVLTSIFAWFIYQYHSKEFRLVGEKMEGVSYARNN